MSLFSKMFDSHESRLRRREKSVKRAMANPEVTALLDDKGLDVDALRDLRLRFAALGIPEQQRADRALQDIELLEWYFSLPDPNTLTLNESMQLTLWVRQSIKP